MEQVLAGAAGFKVHEDWGATPAAIRAALAVADRMDVQVSVHTDTQNEAGFVEDAIAAFDPHVTALAAARNDPDIAAPAQSPKQLVGRHPDRSTDLRINGRPKISH